MCHCVIVAVTLCACAYVIFRQKTNEGGGDQYVSKK